MDHRPAEKDGQAIAAPDEGREPSDAERLRTHSSSLIAKTLEYKLLGDISTELLLRGQTLEVLRSDIDAFGHDVVLELDGIVRHVQLKLKVKGGKNSSITCHTALTMKPSGCIIWITYDPETYTAVEYACFGGSPGEVMPNPGEIVASRSTHTAEGDRPPRKNHRKINYGRFEKITGVAELVDWLFAVAASGDQASPAVITGPGGAMLVSTGAVSVLPIGINITDRLALVRVVFGPGRAADLVAAAHGEQTGSIALIDLNTGTWDHESPVAEDPVVIDALQKATAQLQAEMAQWDREPAE